jgi:membrane-associated protease RseP (regulator of RpoE activity)
MATGIYRESPKRFAISVLFLFHGLYWTLWTCLAAVLRFCLIFGESFKSEISKI